MAKYPKGLHVFNFGNFYMPSFLDDVEDTYNEVDLDAGTMATWEGTMNPTDSDPEYQSYKWPHI